MTKDEAIDYVNMLRARFPRPVKNGTIGSYCVGGALDCELRKNDGVSCPTAERLARDLIMVNPNLSGSAPGSILFAADIIQNNDRGMFEAAWQTMEEALCYTMPRPPAQFAKKRLRKEDSPMTKKHDPMYGRIAQHGEALKALFHLPVGTDPVDLCRRLRCLEAKAAAVALQLCNGPAYATEEEVDQLLEKILAKVDALLGFSVLKIPVFVNRDPRGYALKIDDEWMRKQGGAVHRDWGGYGILAPDLSQLERD